MNSHKRFLKTICYSEAFRVVASFFVITIFVLHIIGFNVPVTFFPCCFSIYVLQDKECFLVMKVLGYFLGLCPFLLILVLTEKFNRLLTRVILYAWLLVDIIFLIVGFNPTTYPSYETLFHGWHPIPEILFDLLLLCWVISCSQTVKRWLANQSVNKNL